MSEKALLIEDDQDLAVLLCEQLGDLGYKIEHADNGRTGLEMALGGDYVFIVLDLMLPELEGTEVCKRIRKQKPLQPLLILTSKSEELDKVLLLELGADDYLTKPFSIRELKARIKTVLRRTSGPSPTSTTENPLGQLTCGELIIDLDTRTVSCKSEIINLTAGEFEILALLATTPGRVFSREQMVEALHGIVMTGYEAAITSHVNRIRSKIEKDPAKPQYLQTVRGVGYRLVEPTDK